MKITDLHTLRISLVRLAQVAGVPLDRFDLSRDSPYEAIVAAAQHHERGWNTLVASIMDEVEQMRRDLAALREPKPMPRVFITVEGGLIQNVTSDVPLDLTVIDFDTDGCTAEDGVVDLDGESAFLHEPWTTEDAAECDRLAAMVEAAQPVEDDV